MPIPAKYVPYCLVVTPEPVHPDVVRAAWSYAIKHTPKSLEEPDFGAALELMKKRHPRWEYIKDMEFATIGYDKGAANKDISETGT